MRPEVTLLTSTELQHALGSPLPEAEMAEVQTFRDTLIDRFRERVLALGAMEELYGRDWVALDLRIWVVDREQETVSSPILIPVQDEDAAVFAVFQALAKKLIRDTPPATSLVEHGPEKIEAVSALLAREALREEMDADAFTTVMEAARAGREEMWDAVDEYAETWDGETPLYEWMEGR